MVDRPAKILSPLLDLAVSAIDPIKVRLQIAIRASDVADIDGKEDVSAIVGPMQVVFYGLVMRKAAGFKFVTIDLEPFRSGRLNEAAGLVPLRR